MQDQEPPRAIPDLGPETYVRWRASELGVITERIERQLIVELAGDVRGKRVLDAGCGDGALAIELWKRGATVDGIDVSDQMITAARASACAHGADSRFSVAAAEALPFPAGHFDVVVAVTILCFVDNAEPVLREMARVLRPGGRLVIGELGKWSPWAAGRRARAWLGSQLWRGGKFWTTRELATLAIGAGLTVEAARGAIFFPRFALAARLLAPFDASFGRLTSIGAAFIALCATKPT